MQADGLCQVHLRRKRLYGDPLAVKMIVGMAEERFWSQIDKYGPLPERRPELGPCWVWTGLITEHGYASMSIRNRHTAMHRFSYELNVGPIPDGLQIDHLCHPGDGTCTPATCRHRRCVNPAHLEPVTNRENTIRGDCPRVTSERCFGVSVPEEHRRSAAAARKVAPVDKAPRECEHCGRSFKGRQALGVHKARAHSDHAPRWPRSQPVSRYPKAS